MCDLCQILSQVGRRRNDGGSLTYGPCVKALDVTSIHPLHLDTDDYLPGLPIWSGLTPHAMLIAEYDFVWMEKEM